MSMIGSALFCDHTGDTTVSTIVNKRHVAKDDNHQRERCFIVVRLSQRFLAWQILPTALEDSIDFFVVERLS
jgi:hypothetical protein